MNETLKITILSILFVFVIPTLIGYLIKKSVLKKIDSEIQMPDPITLHNNISKGFKIFNAGTLVLFIGIPFVIIYAVCSKFIPMNNLVTITKDEAVLFSSLLLLLVILIIAIILMIIGRSIVGCQAYRIRLHRGRECTPLELQFKSIMNYIENRGSTTNLLNQLAINTSDVNIDIVAAGNTISILKVWYATSKLFTKTRSEDVYK